VKLRAPMLAAFVLSPAFAADPLQCPAGSQARRDPGVQEGKREEWCEDRSTKKRHGPGRIVNAKGDPLVNIEFRQNEITSHKFTRAGLEQLLVEVNASFKKQGAPASFSLVDEHTLRFDMILAGRAPGADFEDFKKTIVTQAPVCRMFTPAGTDFRTINIHAANEKKEALGSTTLTRADCEKAADK
jgi:hypothetical protein